MKFAIGAPLETRIACRRALARGEIERVNGAWRLTAAGRERARALVRSHRLWETYLVDVLGLRSDHVHDTAQRLEHVTDPTGAARLTPAINPERDPHDRPIPKHD